MLAKEVLRSIPQSMHIVRRLVGGSLTSGITLPHLRVMFLVKEGQGVSQMAETLHISLAAVSKMVNGLVEKRLIQRLPGKDRRCVGLKLTSKGEKTLASVSGLVEKQIQQGLARLTAEDREDLAKGIKALDQLMNLLNEV